jgi:hypothetical protein
MKSEEQNKGCIVLKGQKVKETNDGKNSANWQAITRVEE